MTGDRNQDQNSLGEQPLKPAPSVPGVPQDAPQQERQLPAAPAIPSKNVEQPVASAPGVPGGEHSKTAAERQLPGPSELPSGGRSGETQVRPAPTVPTSARHETPLRGPTQGQPGIGAGERPVQPVEPTRSGPTISPAPAVPVAPTSPSVPIAPTDQPTGNAPVHGQWQRAATADANPQPYQDTNFGQGVATPNQGQPLAPTGQSGNVFGPQGHVGNPPSAPPPVPPPNSDWIASPAPQLAAGSVIQQLPAGQTTKKIRPGSKGRQIRRQAKEQSSYFALMFLFGAAFFLVVVVLIMIVALAT